MKGRAAGAPTYDVLTMGRVGVDIYPLQTGVGLEDVETFGKFLGGSATNVQAALPHVTVAVGNLDEVDTAVGTRDARAAAAALLEAGVELAVVKQGPEGVYARTRDTEVEVPPVRVKVVNGIGAGDGFGGALCHGLLAGWPLDRIIRFANAAGAIVTTRLECSSAMPTTEEVEDFLRGPTMLAFGHERPR